MIVRVCDICHMAIDGNTRYYHASVWAPEYSDTTLAKNARTLDICEACYKKLDKRAQQIHDAALNTCTCECSDDYDECMHPDDDKDKEGEKAADGNEGV